MDEDFWIMAITGVFITILLLSIGVGFEYLFK